MIHAHSPQLQAAKVLSSNHTSALTMIGEFSHGWCGVVHNLFASKATDFFITEGRREGVFCLSCDDLLAGFSASISKGRRGGEAFDYLH